MHMDELNRKVCGWLVRDGNAAVGGYWRGPRLYCVTTIGSEGGALYSSTLDERNVIRILNQEMKIMTNVLYDRTGVPCAYVAEDGTIFSFVGKPLAFLQNEYVYSFSGAELGTFEDGWDVCERSHRLCAYKTYLPNMPSSGDTIYTTDSANPSDPIY